MTVMRCLSVCMMLVMLVTLGCATAGKGVSDAEQVQAKAKEVAAVANAKDINKLLTYFADDFDCPQIGDKEAFKDFLENARDAGFLDGVEISISAAKTTVDGEEATIEPVIIKGSFGEGEGIFTSRKIKGVWMITVMDVSGL